MDTSASLTSSWSLIAGKQEQQGLIEDQQLEFSTLRSEIKQSHRLEDRLTVLEQVLAVNDR